MTALRQVSRQMAKRNLLTGGFPRFQTNKGPVKIAMDSTPIDFSVRCALHDSLMEIVKLFFTYLGVTECLPPFLTPTPSACLC